MHGDISTVYTLQLCLNFKIICYEAWWVNELTSDYNGRHEAQKHLPNVWKFIPSKVDYRVYSVRVE